MGRKTITTNEFIQQSKLLYGDRFDYSKTIFKGTSNKVILICPTHGEVEQLASTHLRGRGNGCSYCSNKLQLTTEQFIEKAREKHGDKYDYSLVDYKNGRTKVKIICPKHDIFEQIAANHINSSQGCLKCGGCSKHTIESIKNKLNAVHNSFYDYSLIKIYKNNKEKIDIICPKHGVFSQVINSHMNGHGCPSCKNENNGWTRIKFKKHCIKNNNGLGTFYVIKCFNENEEFYKFGITSRPVKQRYCGKRDMPYKFEIIQEITDIPEIIWNFEKSLKTYTKQFRYSPKISFPGSLTECIKW